MSSGQSPYLSDSSPLPIRFFRLHNVFRFHILPKLFHQPVMISPLHINPAWCQAEVQRIPGQWNRGEFSALQVRVIFQHQTGHDADSQSLRNRTLDHFGIFGSQKEIDVLILLFQLFKQMDKITLFVHHDRIVFQVRQGRRGPVRFVAWTQTPLNPTARKIRPHKLSILW